MLPFCLILRQFRKQNQYDILPKCEVVIDNKKIVLRLLKSSYKDISIEELFIKTINISGKFNFLYKNDSIYITLLKTTLEKNYLYYIEELLELIYILKSKKPV